MADYYFPVFVVRPVWLVQPTQNAPLSYDRAVNALQVFVPIHFNVDAYETIWEWMPFHNHERAIPTTAATTTTTAMAHHPYC